MGNNKLKSFRQFLTEEDGMGTVEVVNSIFTKITNQTKKI